jgi:myo-inositol-1(or 4)-monophosphatase
MSYQSQWSSDAIDLSLVREWVAEAGCIALSHHHQVDVRFKDDGTPTTSADREIESYLLGRLSEYYPHHQIIGEEGGVHTGDSDFVWAIDPIDGSRAFASGLPVWGISVGVLRCGGPYAGVFYMPAVEEMYWSDGGRSFCNGSPISRRSSVRFDDPLTFLAVPSNAHHVYEIEFPRVRSLGSTTAHLVYVARGAAIGALTRRVKIWDLAGVLPILNQTGVSLVYLSGAPFDICAIVNGKPAPEPIVAAHTDVIDRVRNSIRMRRGWPTKKCPPTWASVGTGLGAT